MRHRRHIGNDIINADQVVGKTLIAKTAVPLKRYAQPSALVVYTVARGNVVGVVYSWVTTNGVLYWAFYDQNGTPYYAEHRPGRFSLDALQQQGAQTLEDIKEAQEKADNPISYAVTKLLRPVAFAAAAFFIIKAFK